MLSFVDLTRLAGNRILIQEDEVSITLKQSFHNSNERDPKANPP